MKLEDIVIFESPEEILDSKLNSAYLDDRILNSAERVINNNSHILKKLDKNIFYTLGKKDIYFL